MKIKLDEVIEAMEFANEEARYLYSIKTQQIVLLMQGMVDGEDDEDLYEEIMESDDYIALPDKYDIHEYRLMEDFIETISSQRKQVQLYNAIRGRGAFRRFKDTVYELDIEEQWYKYRDQRYEQIAREWCERWNIDIVENHKNG